MNANVRLGMQWMQMPLWICNECRCPLVGISWCKCPLVHAMMQMPFVWMQWMWMPAWVCNECQRPFGYAMNANVPLRIYHDTDALMQTQFIQKFLLFQNEASTTLETKIFSKLDLLFMKSHLPFDLRLPKNWWSLLENLWMGHLLEIWLSGSKDLFSQFDWAMGWHVSKAFFWKNEFFENQTS